VRKIAFILTCLALVWPARSQEEFVPADLLNEANEWLKENVDDEALDALGVDKERVQMFLAELQKHFQGTYVYDLSPLRDTAREIQPILAGFEETEPYALWLKAHLDDFEVSERLRKEAVVQTTNRQRSPPPPSAASTICASSSTAKATARACAACRRRCSRASSAHR
jgi:hypothetical protein